MKMITLTNETLISLKVNGEIKIFRFKNNELEIKLKELTLSVAIGGNR
ncbi:hypothetical protein SAMN02745174_02556 [Cetobacterium ceti]|uniref:Uncharacterized protein n=1 Tax=Cetobacterium ceti TaxID=180163 RepID=A0A1T4R1Z7_9FUSO|nr:hypothetical protein [Cetobacterium ceti]SKA10054.1 hypothetical protein SAMN02745174_02556 [Cetobacterium ceti]